MAQTPHRESVTMLLEAAQQGDTKALGAVFSLLYVELHQEAHRQRQRWQGDYTLNTTALIHEAYLKLVGHPPGHWENHLHFIRIAARAMRQVLINHAEQRLAAKRGGKQPRLSLEQVLESGQEEVLMTEAQAEVYLSLEAALRRLEQQQARWVQIVECRFYGGLTIAETAIALGFSEDTVKRGWNAARAWLHRELQQEPGLQG